MISSAVTLKVRVLSANLDYEKPVYPIPLCLGDVLLGTKGRLSLHCP